MAFWECMRQKGLLTWTVYSTISPQRIHDEQERISPSRWQGCSPQSSPSYDCSSLLLEDGIYLEGVQKVCRLLVDKHRRLAASSFRKLPQLVSDVVFGHKFLGSGMVLVNDPHHLQQAEGCQSTCCLQHLHHDACQTSDCHLNLHNPSESQNFAKLKRGLDYIDDAIA